MSRFFRYSLLISFGCIAIPVLAQEGACPDGRQHHRMTLRHIESGGIGYDNGYTTFEGFFAADPTLWHGTPFLDLRGHIFDDGKFASNAGAGVRGLWGKRAYGINSYYDYRKTSQTHFNQIGLGLETLGKLFDFRINGYLPVGKKMSGQYDLAFARFVGNTMIESWTYQVAMKGADAEFGFHAQKWDNLELYFAAGPYYFIGEMGSTAWGGKARIAAKYKDFISFEVSDSYDRVFENKIQGQLALNFPLGPKSKVEKKNLIPTCKLANTLTNRMLQPVERKEIVVVNKPKQDFVAIDPTTGLPYFFVFVDNLSASEGTFESPYHSLAQAEANSSPNDIIYIFPGDGTTKDMDSGIILKTNQKLWGSGINQSLVTTQGQVSIPAQSTTYPTITNMNIDTELNAVTLATNNAISGLKIRAALNDAIYGVAHQNLEVSSCIIENTTTYAIETEFSDDATIVIANNQFLDNVNGILLLTSGTTNLVCSGNTFTGQTSESSIPLTIVADHNTFTGSIMDNVFDSNMTGSVRIAFESAVNVDINAFNNTFTNNSTGSQGTGLGSNFVIIADGTTDRCSIVLEENTFSGNVANAYYMYTGGAITTLEVTATANEISGNGGSAFVLATPVDNLIFVATDNLITGCQDSVISVIASGSSSTGNITINNNILTDGTSNAIAVNQIFTNLNLTIQDNAIERFEGTGILSYANDPGIDSFLLDISGNTINNCQNLGSNAASGINIEQYTSLTASVLNNTLSENTGLPVFIGTTRPTPFTCLTLTGNSSTEYTLSNPVSGTFNLAPCDADAANVGMINTTGTVDLVQSCPGAVPCP